MTDEPPVTAAAQDPPWLQEAVERMLWRLRKAGAELKDDDDLFLLGGPRHAAYPAHIVTDQGLTGTDVRVYLYLRQQAEGGGAGTAWQGYRKALADLGISRGTLALAIARLRLARWIALARRVRHPDGRWAGNLYVVFDEPREVEEITRIDDLYLEWVQEVVLGHRDRRARELAAETIAQIQKRLLEGSDNPLRSGLDPLQRHLIAQGLVMDPRGGRRAGPRGLTCREVRMGQQHRAGVLDAAKADKPPATGKHTSCQCGGTTGTTTAHAINPGRHNSHQRSNISGITVKHKTCHQGGTSGTTRSSSLEPGSPNEETNTCDPGSKFELGSVGSSSRSNKTTTTTTTTPPPDPERSAIRTRARRGVRARDPLAGLRWPSGLAPQDRFLVGQVLLTVGEEHRQPVLDALRVRLDAVKRGAEPLRYPPHRYVRALCERVRQGTFEPVDGAVPVAFEAGMGKQAAGGGGGREDALRELRSRIASLEQLIAGTPSEELRLLLGQQLREAKAELEALRRDGRGDGE